jgi:hypothetical protein
MIPLAFREKMEKLGLYKYGQIVLYMVGTGVMGMPLYPKKILLLRNWTV